MTDYDYVSPGLEVVHLDYLFPNMVVGDKAKYPWKYLRGEVPHNWYVDKRYPGVGFINRDEAVLLYNLALQFKGKQGLEIGCFMGWSSAHIAKAGVVLDIVDPAIAGPEQLESVHHALSAIGAKGQFHIARSPEAAARIAKYRGKGWNFFFIDGDHMAPAPEFDARVCLKYAEPDAMFVFHDVIAPDVEKGLAFLRDAGLNTMLYNTMQIMGVAWRGNVSLVKHVPDPNHDWTLPDYLQEYDHD